MNGTDLKMLPLNEVRQQYRAYLETQDLSRNTINTICTDSFYLWRKVSREDFWAVLESGDFEDEAKAAMLAALKEHSKGNAESLLNGYMAHLRRFRRFAYSDTSFAVEGHPKPMPAEKPRKAHGGVEVPRPSPEQVTYYLRKWDALENYHLQECALDKLFHQLCPENKTIEDILLKAATLNDFYSTNIYSIFPVAKHILELDIDSCLAAGWVELVDEIQAVVIGGKEHHFYSFASKYCSHHNEKDFPIYDSFVDEVLRYFRARDGFARFRNEELKVYPRFKELLIAFRSFYGLGQFSLKEVDKYIWQLGKEYFPKSYGKRKAENETREMERTNQQ